MSFPHVVNNLKYFFGAKNYWDNNESERIDKIPCLTKYENYFDWVVGYDIYDFMYGYNS